MTTVIQCLTNSNTLFCGHALSVKVASLEYGAESPLCVMVTSAVSLTQTVYSETAKYIAITLNVFRVLVSGDE